MTAQIHHRHSWLPIVAALAVAIGVNASASRTAHAEASRSKLDKQVGVMERLLNEMLVDSPNFLVAGQDVAEGFQVDDAGAIFTFRASLTGLGWQRHGAGSFLNFWPFSTDKHRTIVIRKDGKDEDGAMIDLGDGKIVIKEGELFIDQDGNVRKLTEKDPVHAISDKEYREDQLKKYAAAKEELIRFLLDYGETLSAMPGDQFVRIVVRLGDVEFPEGREVRSLILRARIEDLRSFGDGRLGEGAARAKIDIRES